MLSLCTYLYSLYEHVGKFRMFELKLTAVRDLHWIPKNPSPLVLLTNCLVHAVYNMNKNVKICLGTIFSLRKID